MSKAILRPVTPLSLTVGFETFTIDGVRLDIRYDLQDCYALVYYYQGSEQKFDQIIQFTQAEIDAWGEDNSYIINLAAQKAGVVLV